MSPPSEKVGGHTFPASPTKLRPWLIVEEYAYVINELRQNVGLET